MTIYFDDEHRKDKERATEVARRLLFTWEEVAELLREEDLVAVTSVEAHYGSYVGRCAVQA